MESFFGYVDRLGEDGYSLLVYALGEMWPAVFLIIPVLGVAFLLLVYGAKIVEPVLSRLRGSLGVHIYNLFRGLVLIVAGLIIMALSIFVDVTRTAGQLWLMVSVTVGIVVMIGGVMSVVKAIWTK